MKFLLASALLLLTLVVAACSGSRPANEASVPAAPPASQVSRDNLPKIVAFGDSLTAGLGLADPRQNYPSLLQQKLDADGYQYEVVNAGVSGDTSAGGLRRIDWSLKGDVRFLILELGANDHLRGQPVAETKKNLSQIIERANSRGVRVILAGMLTTTNSGDKYLREVRDMYQSLAREHDVPIIPFFLEGVAGVEALNQKDNIHPNADGTRIVAETVYAALKPLLEK